MLRRTIGWRSIPATSRAPRPIEFPTDDGLTAHAFYYPPRTPTSRAGGRRPPLLVRATAGRLWRPPQLDLDMQYWTSRGFAVLDVNYGGSTGYGRAYRERLDGTWGIVDVDDCVQRGPLPGRAGKVDGDRLVIHGGSAGGYTTLCALTFRDVFSGGRQLLRRRRPGGAGARHAQVRVALPGRLDRPVPRSAAMCTASARRSITPIGCRAR